eukprot:COSAG05_NODE_48_length_24425_cov_90.438543_9_plen_203_part_00
MEPNDSAGEKGGCDTLFVSHLPQHPRLQGARLRSGFCCCSSRQRAEAGHVGLGGRAKLLAEQASPAAATCTHAETPHPPDDVSGGRLTLLTVQSTGTHLLLLAASPLHFLRHRSSARYRRWNPNHCAPCFADGGWEVFEAARSAGGDARQHLFTFHPLHQAQRHQRARSLRRPQDHRSAALLRHDGGAQAHARGLPDALPVR